MSANQICVPKVESKTQVSQSQDEEDQPQEYVLSLEDGYLYAQSFSASGSVTQTQPARISTQVWEQICDKLISITPLDLTSVKRKRKLKMNKHKFKKRLRRQRALRKRLGK